MTLAGCATLGSAAAAQADADDWRIERYDVVAELQPDGGAQVSIDLDFDFGPDRDAHGPYLSIVERQEIQGDPDRYRVLEVSGVSARSSTGAPTDLLVEREDGAVLVRVGDEDVEISGVHSYTINYHLDSVVTPADADADADAGAGADADADGPAGATGVGDVLIWNAVGLGWEVPMSDVSVTITAPVPASSAACVAGSVHSVRPCDGQVSLEGTAAVFHQSALRPGQGLTVRADYPADTFPDATLAYAPRHTMGNSFPLTPATGAVSGLVLLAGAGVAVSSRRRARAAVVRSEDAPAAGATTSSAIPEGFRTAPPREVPPGELGTLIDGRAQTRDVMAVLLDLAVRGAVHIETLPDEEDGESRSDDAEAKREAEQGESPNLQLVRPPGPVDLRDYERTLLAEIFGDQEVVTVSERSAEIAAALGNAATALDAAVAGNGWFVASPRLVRRKWYLIGGVLTLVGLAATAALALTLGWGLVGIAVTVVGIGLGALAPSMPTRTAAGRDLTGQAQAFERYLRDVSAPEPNWPEGRAILLPSLFERYLPYAVALGLEQRWATAFARAVAKGEVPQPAWYVATNQAAFWSVWAGGGFADSLTTLHSSAAATPSGGGSVSVGGGASGGGGGGW